MVLVVVEIMYMILIIYEFILNYVYYDLWLNRKKNVKNCVVKKNFEFFIYYMLKKKVMWNIWIIIKFFFYNNFKRKNKYILFRVVEFRRNIFV